MADSRTMEAVVLPVSNMKSIRESGSEVSLSVLIRGWQKISGMRGTPAATKEQGRLLFIHPGAGLGNQVVLLLPFYLPETEEEGHSFYRSEACMGNVFSFFFFFS